VGRVKVHSVIGDHLLNRDDTKEGGTIKTQTPLLESPENSARTIFLPINHDDGSNPQIKVETPYPGIFIYRFSEGFNYPNCNHYLDNLVAHIFENTRRTNPATYGKLGVCKLIHSMMVGC
jgi:sodium-independent sulfate anion transporter 11